MHPAATTYKLKISQSGIETELTSSSPSLTELVRLAHAFVPGMDKYQKVYSETRKTLGGYVRLFVFVVGKSEYRRITVSIEFDKIFPADLARFLSLTLAIWGQFQGKRRNPPGMAGLALGNDTSQPCPPSRASFRP